MITRCRFESCLPLFNMAKFSVQRHIVRGAPKRARWGKAKQCYWCGISVSYGIDNRPTQATREHLVPKSMEGGGGSTNIAVACKRCNSARGTDISWIPYRDIPMHLRVYAHPMRVTNGHEYIPALKEHRV